MGEALGELLDSDDRSEEALLIDTSCVEKLVSDICSLLYIKLMYYCSSDI